MIIAGLTGGIASGKSTVAKFLEESGAIIIDADKIAHSVLKKDFPAWRAVINAFGTKILLPDGEINRKHLGNIIFKSPEKKKRLNRIVHPYVFKEMKKKIDRIQNKSSDAVVILDVPLLIESGMYEKYPEIIVVYVPEHIQVERLVDRDRLSRKDALLRIHSQLSMEKKKEFATLLIDNSASIENTRKRTCEIFKYLKQINCKTI